MNEGSWGFLFVYLFIIEKWFIYNVVLITAVEQSDSVMHTHVHTHTHILFYSFPLWVYYRILNVVPWDLVAYIGPCCLLILYMIACIC